APVLSTIKSMALSSVPYEQYKLKNGCDLSTRLRSCSRVLPYSFTRCGGTASAAASSLSWNSPVSWVLHPRRWSATWRRTDRSAPSGSPLRNWRLAQSAPEPSPPLWSASLLLLPRPVACRFPCGRGMPGGAAGSAMSIAVRRARRTSPYEGSLSTRRRTSH
ncbi:hypothetical protein Vafri_7180, partial [Volvox africanus]